MKIETITYKRVKNLGNYQTETIEMTAVLDQYDDPNDVSQELRELVKNQLFPPEPALVATETDDF
ncbi:MAG: hypothetical protein V7K25_13265 [Nostoc sp.]|uniref:hypothetical protein n=1 Tax=Nostoc sp. TaxID=1180 RepID=UPI002FFBF6B7